MYSYDSRKWIYNPSRHRLGIDNDCFELLNLIHSVGSPRVNKIYHTLSFNVFIINLSRKMNPFTKLTFGVWIIWDITKKS